MQVDPEAMRLSRIMDEEELEKAELMSPHTLEVKGPREDVEKFRQQLIDAGFAAPEEFGRN